MAEQFIEHVKYMCPKKAWNSCPDQTLFLLRGQQCMHVIELIITVPVGYQIQVLNHQQTYDLLLKLANIYRYEIRFKKYRKCHACPYVNGDLVNAPLKNGYEWKIISIGGLWNTINYLCENLN